MELQGKGQLVPYFDAHETRRDPTLDPSLAMKEGPREKSDAAPSKTRYELNFDHNAPMPQFLEEMTGHWGIRVSLRANAGDEVFDGKGKAKSKSVSSSLASLIADETGGCCAYCSLPLMENVGRTGSRLTVFPCGHAFHQFCTTEDGCPYCLYQNFPKLTSFFAQ